MVIPITSEISMYQWWWLSVFCIPAISQLYLNYIPVNYIPITHWYPNNIPIHKSLFLQNPYTIKKWSRRGNLHDSGHWRRWCLHPLWCMAPECPRGRRQGRMNGFAEADFLGESGGYHGDIWYTHILYTWIRYIYVHIHIDMHVYIYMYIYIYVYIYIYMYIYIYTDTTFFLPSSHDVTMMCPWNSPCSTVKCEAGSKMCRFGANGLSSNLRLIKGMTRNGILID